MLIEQVEKLIGDGDAVVAWDAPDDNGLTFETFGAGRRMPVDFDRFRHVAFRPPDGLLLASVRRHAV
jgi:CRISPR-associated protein Cas2